MNANKNRLERVARLMSLAVAGLILLGCIINFLRPIYFEAGIGLASLIIFIWFQFFLNRLTRLHNPPGMQIGISILVFFSVFLGRFFALYKQLPGFDKSQHFLYGMAFGICGFILFYRLNPGQGRKLSVSAGTVGLFSVCIALTCGFAWEVFEFISDRLFDTNMQAWKQGLAHGLTDTMLDLMVDFAGSALVAAIAKRLLRRDPQAFYRRWIAIFLTGQANEPAAVLQPNLDVETRGKI